MNSNLLTIQERGQAILKAFQQDIMKGGKGSGPHKRGETTDYYSHDYDESHIKKIKGVVGKNEKTLGRKLTDDEIDHILLNHDFHSSVRKEMIEKIKKD